MADELDLAEWTPSVEESANPSDAAAAHDAWFRAEVRKAIAIADDPATVWISNEEAKRQSAMRRAEWLRKLDLRAAES